MGEIAIVKDGGVGAATSGPLILIATGTRDISDAAWQQLWEDIAKLRKKQGVLAAVLVHAPKKHPTLAQQELAQKQHAKTLGLPAGARSAVLFAKAKRASTATKAATFWSSGEIELRCFPPDAADAALAWLKEKAAFDPADAKTMLAKLAAAIN
ncbi:MAG: hypothetical protein IT381_15620 [Deltaproteobacteria bacterium]|nr:hypothetical protein [Deltaproteobacteria bacterium]